MIVKKIMSDYVYQIVMGLLFIQVPILASPLIKPFVMFFANRWLKPAFGDAGRFIDFKIIDAMVEKQDKNFKEAVSELKKIEESNKEVSPEEEKLLRDKFHASLDNLVKHPKSY